MYIELSTKNSVLDLKTEIQVLYPEPVLLVSPTVFINLTIII